MPADGNDWSFDWKRPDYAAIFRERARRLAWIRAERVRHLAAPNEIPDPIAGLKRHYRDHIPQFISDWGMTFDPRNVERDLPATIPFILFPKQVDWIEWVIDHWRRQSPGLTEKSRDMGISWLAMATACSLALHFDGFSAGFGSRKEEYVDRIGSPKALFWRAREFMRYLPEEFRGGFVSRRDAPFMRISFPETGSVITGEAGDNIGRGDRQSIYFVDEHAYLEHPDLAEASLSNVTNCQMDMSSVHGMANAFAQKRHKVGMPDDYVFVFDWRDDPRKDQAWYDKQVAEKDPVIVAQEIDRDYAASVEGVVIPGAWVRAAIDFHLWAGISVSGARYAAMDVADEGKDKNAVCGAHGFLVEHVEDWSGKGSDIFTSVEYAFGVCDERDYALLVYDGDGLGAGVRGDGRIINADRKRDGKRIIRLEAFRGSGEIIDPHMEDEKGRTNEDFFASASAQAWWNLRRRFRNTFRWRTQGIVSPVESIIAISSKTPAWQKLIAELSQATYSLNGVGKILIDKTPEGAKSPNLADAVKIRFAKRSSPVIISDAMVQRARRH